MKQGWNFVTITPEMVSVMYNKQSIAGTCEIEKSYLFNSDNQEWVTLSDETLIQGIDGPEDEDYLGLGWLIKVSDDCNLGGGSSVSPPTIPDNGGNSQQELSDEDFIKKDFGSLKFMQINDLPRTPNSEGFVEGKYAVYSDGTKYTYVFISRYEDEQSAFTNSEDSFYADETSGFFGESITKEGTVVYEIKEIHDLGIVDYSLIWISGDKHIFVQESDGEKDDEDYNNIFRNYLNKYPTTTI